MKNIRSIVPLLPAQQLMLAASIKNECETYIQQLLFEVNGHSYDEIFIAIEKLIQGYECFRSIILYEGLKQPVWVCKDDIKPSFIIHSKTISELQEWLEEVNPHYIQCLPSILKELNVAKISNFIDWKGTGELGGTMYSTEECGTIAILCPDNPNVYHVMENMYVETDTDGGIIVTSMTNPYIKRYKHGDHIEMGECTCGRTMQAIKEIKGRTRNMFTLPNGDKKWPLLGSHYFFERFGIKRFRAIQTSIDELELEIICEPLGEKENDVKSLVNTMLESPINVIIRYVETFPNYKFEEFISKV